MNRTRIILAAICLASAALPLAAQNPPARPDTRTEGKSQARSAAQPNRGEKVFQQNCSRCHNAPQGFSPRISGTIVRHMRVRASLSAADEKALLKFLNP
jgi:cytochrome c5